MITRSELVQIGQFKKPHGIKGEITFTFTNDSFIEIDRPFFVCEIDGIFVPFLVTEYRIISDSTAYIQLKNIDSEQKVRFLSNKPVFFPRKQMINDVEKKSFSWDSFTGFTVIDKSLGKIGTIVEIDKTTVNTLFIVENGDKEILIPAVKEFIVRIDEERGELVLELPEGLVG